MSDLSKGAAWIGGDIIAIADAGIPVTFDRGPGDHTWDYAAGALPQVVARWREAAG